MAAAALVCALATACSAFENRTPESINFRMTGTAATRLQVIYATQFVAGVDEAGTTQVQVFRTDTVVQAMPIDLVVDISVDQRFFVQATPVDLDQAAVQIHVNVDDRALLDDSGDIFASDPFRYVYVFNQRVTRIVDVVF